MQQVDSTRPPLPGLLKNALDSIPETIGLMAELTAIIPEKDFLFPDKGKYALPLATDTFRGRISYVNSSIWEFIRHSHAEFENIYQIFQQLNQYLTSSTNARNFWGYFNIIKERVRHLERNFFNTSLLISHTASDCKEARDCFEDSCQEHEVLKSRIRLRMNIHKQEITQMTRKAKEIGRLLHMKVADHDASVECHILALWREVALIQRLMLRVVTIDRLLRSIMNPGFQTLSPAALFSLSKPHKSSDSGQLFSKLIEDLINIDQVNDVNDLWLMNKMALTDKDGIMNTKALDHSRPGVFYKGNSDTTRICSRGTILCVRILEGMKYLTFHGDSGRCLLQQTKMLRSSSREFRASTLHFLVNVTQSYYRNFRNYNLRKFASDLSQNLSDFNLELNDGQFEKRMTELDELFEKRALTQHLLETASNDLLYFDTRQSELVSHIEVTEEVLKLLLQMQRSWKVTHDFILELLFCATHHETAVFKGINCTELTQHVNMMQHIYSTYLKISNKSILGRLSFSWMMLTLIGTDYRRDKPLSGYVTECQTVRTEIRAKLESCVQTPHRQRETGCLLRVPNASRQISHPFTRQSSIEIKRLEAEEVKEELKSHGVNLIFVSSRDIPSPGNNQIT